MPNGNDKLPSEINKELPTKQELQGRLNRAMGSAQIIKQNPSATKRQKAKADSVVNSIYNRAKNVAKQKRLRKESRSKLKKVHQNLKEANMSMYSNPNRMYSPSENRRRERMKNS